MCQEVHSRTWMINRLMWQEPLQRCHSPISGHAMLTRQWASASHSSPLSCAPQRIMHALCYGEITALLINWCIHTNTLQETCSHTQDHTSPIHTHTTCSHALREEDTQHTDSYSHTLPLQPQATYTIPLTGDTEYPQWPIIISFCLCHTLASHILLLTMVMCCHCSDVSSVGGAVWVLVCVCMGAKWMCFAMCSIRSWTRSVHMAIMKVCTCACSVGT